MSIDEAKENLENYLKLYHRNITIDDLEITDTKGYWRIKKPCGGLKGGCRNQIHTTLFNEGPIQHTISYFDNTRDSNGRFTSPYKTWNALRLGKENLPLKQKGDRNGRRIL